MKRIAAIAAAVVVALVGGWMVFAPASRPVGDAGGRKVIVIGMDGMDPRLCDRLMNEGQLPNLARLRDAGGFKPLGTSIPPQSPVAWSNFITGADPGTHGIFDFVHRDPSRQYEGMYYSAAETRGIDPESQLVEEGWQVGDFRIPLTFWPFNHKAPVTLLKREGVPFWDYLDAARIPIRLYDIPANYPPSESHHGHMCCLAGMGVPDLMGSYGTYQHFSEDTIVAELLEGGWHFPVTFAGRAAKLKILGPSDPMHATVATSGYTGPAQSSIPFEVYRHDTADEARIDIQGRSIVLRKGEWSDWIQIAFELERPSFLPNDFAPGICRFYLQEVRPLLRLYVTPINIDPSNPAGQKVTEPAEFIEELAEKLGLFYTAGFQEDHKALTNRVFTDEEYKEQAAYVLEERLSLLDAALKEYREGLLFFYFSSTDLQAHMFWWDSDEPHPYRTPEQAREYHGVVADVYRRMDEVVGRILADHGSDTTIMVMSDHGFCNFRREFNLNSWLRDEGYIYPPDCGSLLDPRHKLVDWSKTRAYGMGLNSLYLNLAGRERDGIVTAEQREALLTEISEKLLAVRDPKDGKPVIARVYRADEVYHGPQTVNAPDLIVGYHRDYRASWATVQGRVFRSVFQDNKKAWSADHCVAAEEVPGVLFSNRPLLREDPSLIDLAPTILAEFGLPPGPQMRGGSVFTAREERN